MSPTAQRIAIAQACGADWRVTSFVGEDRIALSFASHPNLGPDRTDLPDGRVLAGDIPDYLKDLNAMHEAEKLLLTTQGSVGVCVYCEQLSDMTGNRFFMVHATAAERAKAFLCTFNRWDPSK